MDFLQYRSNALQSLSLLSGTKYDPKFHSNEEKEQWIQENYLKHYPKTKTEPNTDTVKCCDCDFIGKEADLVDFTDESTDYIGPGCPKCKTDEYLMDIP